MRGKMRHVSGAKWKRLAKGRRAKRSKRLDLSLSLQELEGEDWGEPTFDSYVVTTCHHMRRKPLKDVTIEELRLAIGQGCSLNWLIPVALPILAENPLAEGDFYEGDLLAKVLGVPRTFWEQHPKWREQIDEIARRGMAMCERDGSFLEYSLEWLREAYGRFCAGN